MGKEAKIGVAVILILVITLGVVLAKRLTGTTDAPVASVAEKADKQTPKTTSESAPKKGKSRPSAAGSKRPTLLAANESSSKTQQRPDWRSRARQSADSGAAAGPPPSNMMPWPSAPSPADAYQRYGMAQQSVQALQAQQGDRASEDPNQTYDPLGNQASQVANAPNAQIGQTPETLRVLRPPSRAAQDAGRGYRYASSSRNDYAVRQMPDYRQTARHSVTTVADVNEDGQYEVQPNDSYWVISNKIYGCGSYFKALAEHNREVVPREDQLQVGDVISAPSVQELEKTYPALCPKPSRRETIQNRASTASTRSPYVGGRTYTVEEGDTLFDIARYELGKASRWVEIHELNHHVLGSDFDYLTPGIELVLPSDEDANDTVTQRPGPGSVYQR